MSSTIIYNMQYFWGGALAEGAPAAVATSIAGGVD